MPPPSEATDLVVIQNKVGDDRPWTWELLNIEGEPLPAAGFVVRAQVRKSPNGPVLHEWSTDNERATVTSTGTGTDADPTRWWASLLVDDSRDWDWEYGWFDVFLFDPQGRGQPIVPRGRWFNLPAYTDRPSERTGARPGGSTGGSR